jgi:hypothetical protein
LPFRVDELVAAIRSVIDGTYTRTEIGTAGRFGTQHGVPTIEVGHDPAPQAMQPEPTQVQTQPETVPQTVQPATNGAPR